MAKPATSAKTPVLIKIEDVASYYAALDLCTGEWITRAINNEYKPTIISLNISQRLYLIYGKLHDELADYLGQGWRTLDKKVYARALGDANFLDRIKLMPELFNADLQVLIFGIVDNLVDTFMKEKLLGSWQASNINFFDIIEAARTTRLPRPTVSDADGLLIAKAYEAFDKVYIFEPQPYVPVSASRSGGAKTPDIVHIMMNASAAEMLAQGHSRAEAQARLIKLVTAAVRNAPAPGSK